MRCRNLVTCCDNLSYRHLKFHILATCLKWILEFSDSSFFVICRCSMQAYQASRGFKNFIQGTSSTKFTNTRTWISWILLKIPGLNIYFDWTTRISGQWKFNGSSQMSGYQDSQPYADMAHVMHNPSKSSSTSLNLTTLTFLVTLTPVFLLHLSFWRQTKRLVWILRFSWKWTWNIYLTKLISFVPAHLSSFELRSKNKQINK